MARKNCRMIKKMKKSEFEANFRKSIEVAYHLAVTHVVQHLPRTFLFYLYPNSSNDDSVPLKKGETIFPEDSPLGYDCYGPLDSDEAIGYLWRTEAIPEWIDISVISEDKVHTYFRLLICGRFTKDINLLYHQKEGYSPFHALSPYLPPGFGAIAPEGNKFDLYWGSRRTLLGKILRKKTKLNSTSLSR